eukprot:scaffold615_cov334-Prasinococcus_capsulatus_cf.AAC.3
MTHPKGKVVHADGPGAAEGDIAYAGDLFFCRGEIVGAEAPRAPIVLCHRVHACQLAHRQRGRGRGPQRWRRRRWRRRRRGA